MRRAFATSPMIPWRNSRLAIILFLVSAAPAYQGYIAKKSGVRRFVYDCSCSVYGHKENDLLNEGHPAVCAYPYGFAKLQSAQAVMQFDCVS